MKKALLLPCFALMLSFTVFGQSRIQEILTSARDFEIAVSQAEAYFAEKHPGVRAMDLCSGEHRDGDFVKFKRWEAFWKEHLNADGTLGDPTAFHRANAQAQRAAGPFDDVIWTNLSYENYIDMQIGLGRTTSIGFHPTDINTFYVGAAIGGIWKTTDGGQNYTPIGDNLPHLAVSGIVVNADDPEEVFVALSDHVWYGPPSIGVYKTQNGGETWEATALTFEFTDNVRIYWMTASPFNANEMFVGTADGLYRSSDGLETVELINSVNTRDLKFHPTDSNIAYQGGSSGEFLRSTDGGVTFDLVQDLGGDPVMIAVTPLDPDRVFVRVGNALRKSFSSGEGFLSSMDQLPDNGAMLIFSPENEDVILSGWFDVWRSDNEGSSFDQITHWLNDNNLPDIHVDQRNVFVNPIDSEHVYFCNDGGLYKYHVETNDFVNLCDGLMITQFYDIAVSQSDVNVIGGGSQDNGNVLRNSDGEWIEYAGTGDGMNQEIDPFNSNVRYWSYQYGGMRRNISGNNQGIAPPGEDGNGDWETPYKLDPNYPDHMICAFGNVYESWNQGNAWEDISGPLQGGSNMEQIAFAPSNVNRIYVARTGSLWEKDVLSNDWQFRSLPANSLSDLEVDHINMDVIYITVPGYVDGSKVYRSMDAGDNWENISGSLPNVSTGAIETYDVVAGGLFVGTDAGVYYRDDTYDDWQLYGSIPNTRVADIEIQYESGKIRIGTHGRGVLEADVSIGVCNGVDDADSDGVCDNYDACPGFDDALLGTPCDDGNDDTIDDVYTYCDVCAGVLDVSVGEINRPELEIYPNPSTGLFQVNSTNFMGGQLQVFDLAGQLITEMRIESNATTLDLSEVVPGMYTVKALSAEGNLAVQSTVQKR